MLIFVEPERKLEAAPSIILPAEERLGIIRSVRHASKSHGLSSEDILEF